MRSEEIHVILFHASNSPGSWLISWLILGSSLVEVFPGKALGFWGWVISGCLFFFLERGGSISMEDDSLGFHLLKSVGDSWAVWRGWFPLCHFLQYWNAENCCYQQLLKLDNQNELYSHLELGTGRLSWLLGLKFVLALWQELLLISQRILDWRRATVLPVSSFPRGNWRKLFIRDAIETGLLLLDFQTSPKYTLILVFTSIIPFKQF